MKKLQPIKSSCGGQGCDIKKYVLPFGIKKADTKGKKDRETERIKKAA